jgi:hypothetical protein
MIQTYAIVIGSVSFHIIIIGTDLNCFDILFRHQLELLYDSKQLTVAPIGVYPQFTNEFVDLIHLHTVIFHNGTRHGEVDKNVWS